MSDPHAMLEILNEMYCNAPKTEQEIKAEIDKISKQLGLRCKACGKEIDSENCFDHWFFQCNPDYKPQPILFPFELKSPEAK
jgi:hypothetical protein